MKLKYDEMHSATTEFMDRMGYFAGGPCYDVEIGARWGVIEVDGTDYTLVCGMDPDDEYWFCEDDDGFWTSVADSADMAIAGWLVTALAHDAWTYAEHGCEDAVNFLAYWTFSIMWHGYKGAATHGKGPDFRDDEQWRLIDGCMTLAHGEIKRLAGDEWEEF